MSTRVFAYLRVSTAGQIDGDGFDRQLEACQAFCARKGWEIARVFREQQSGSDSYSDRKFLAEALDLAGNSAIGIDTIIVERSDRLSRDLIVAELFLAECKVKQVKIYAADSGEELVNATGDPTRTLIRQVLGAVAQWDKSVIVRKMQQGRKAKSQRTGTACGGPPPSPYGDRGSIAQKNQERLIIKNILRMRGEGHSFQYIAERLRNCRIQNPHPNLGRGNKHASFFWGRKTVERLAKIWANRKEMNE